jgi:DNA-binding MarR family transcriptional regulator
MTPMPTPAPIIAASASNAGTNPAVPAPRVPETIEQTGLSVTFLEQHLLRTMYFRGELIGREIARAVGLKFSIIEPFLESFKRAQLIQLKRSAGMGNVSGYFSLTELGRHHAQQYVEMTQYVGPAPVPLADYVNMVRLQRPEKGWLTRSALEHAYRRLILGDDILDQIGPAIASGNSFLIYGQPGNGKTYLAEAMMNLDQSHIYMPYAIECQGSIVQIYDKLFHEVIEEEEVQSAVAVDPGHDRRWFKCRRPFIMSGGELTLEMLDLTFNPVSKVYDAPLHLKANNGIYLIDDFGRQRVTPAEVLNRWIVPMERRIDYLSLRTGGKITVPFDAFLVFSTNFRPDQLGDEAFLRRIQYKMHLRNPREEEFTSIFWRFCQNAGLECPPSLPSSFIETYYLSTGKRMRRCHPRDVLSHALDLIHFEKAPKVLTADLLDRAFRSCFTEISDMES